MWTVTFYRRKVSSAESPFMPMPILAQFRLLYRKSAIMAEFHLRSFFLFHLLRSIGGKVMDVVREKVCNERKCDKENCHVQLTGLGLKYCIDQTFRDGNILSSYV